MRKRGGTPETVATTRASETIHGDEPQLIPEEKEKDAPSIDENLFNADVWIQITKTHGKTQLGNIDGLGDILGKEGKEYVIQKYGELNGHTNMSGWEKVSYAEFKKIINNDKTNSIVSVDEMKTFLRKFSPRLKSPTPEETRKPA
jgi:hypothetical protein